METADAGSRPLPFTTIGRPLDPSYPTNTAVLALMGLSAVLAGGVALAEGAGPGSAALAAGGGALAALLAWAIAREIAPDDERVGAFAALALGVAAYVWLDAALLPAATALLLARLVCRSTGLPASVADSLVVSLLTLFACWRSGTPWPAAIAGVAFGLDAVLRPGLARQWLFAGLCVAGGVALTSTGLTPRVVPLQPDLLPRLGATVIIVGTVALIVATRSVVSTGDHTGERLSVARVRAAQFVALLVAVAFAASGSTGLEHGAVIWAALTGVIVSAAVSGLRARR